jgi:hypothetical protein
VKALCGFAAATLAVLLLPGCGGGGSKTAKALEEWLHAWRGDVRVGERPNAFRVPASPVVKLPQTADDLGRDVRTASGHFSDTTGIAYDESKRVFCTWFAWYVDTGQTVPNEDDFEVLLLRYGFGRVLTGPPSQEFRDAVGLFRDSIARAQDEDEATRNAAAAAVCAT